MSAPENFQLPAHHETVRAEWVDYNGHMNVAYYVLAFDHATDGLLDRIGLDEAARAASDGSVFVVEAHVTYDNEVMQGDKLLIETRVLDVDDKRMHVFHRMTLDGGDADTTIATNELMILYVDMAARRSAPMPLFVREALERLRDDQAHLPPPPQAGRSIGIRRRP